MKFRLFHLSLMLFWVIITGCTSIELSSSKISIRELPELAKNPNEQVRPSVLNPGFERHISSADPLVTYCAKDTGPAASPEEKRWRDGFSVEVMERICNKEPEFAKVRVEYSDWMKSKYLETSWTYGLNLTGVSHGIPRGTAITSRHVIFTKHYGYHLWPGDTIWFITMDNRLIKRTIVDYKYLENADLAVTRLDSDLPGSITPLKVLDPEAYKLVPDSVPVLRIQQNNKALIVLKKGNSFWPPGELWSWPYKNPAEEAYAQYYQDMIRFDSSSPSILLLRNEFGVMPILFGLVTWAGVGDGPQVHSLISDIQKTIESFGDAHQLERAMPPVTPYLAPSCSISATRGTDGKSCELTIQASADPVTGNPVVTPVSPTSWTVSQNTWKGNVPCSSDPETVFEATLTGPGGRGRTCESAKLGPLVPQCDLSVIRRGNSQVCDVSVTRLTGNPFSAPVLTPNNPADWNRVGEVWTGTTACELSTSTLFSASLSDEGGQGMCSFTLPPEPSVPICEITSARIDFSDTCEVAVTRKSGIASGNPTVTPRTPERWTQIGDKFTGTVACPIDEYSTFFANLTGPMGTGPICKSPSVLAVSKLVPFCEFQAERQGVSNLCKLSAKQIRGYLGGTPVAFPKNPKNWINSPGTLNWEGTVPCGYNASFNFTAYMDIQRNVPGQICQAPRVDKIPAPACTLKIERQGVSNKCNYSLSPGSISGTISSYNFNGITTRTPWNGDQPLSGQFACKQTSDSTFNASVIGMGPTPQSGSCSASVPKLIPPSCQLTAKRRARTSICDLTLVTLGIIDAAKTPKLNPLGRGNWSGSVWNGTGQCALSKSTAFAAVVYGPGGSEASCVSPVVPKL